MHEDFEYVKSLEKEIDELESEKADFSNIYDLLLEECVSKDVICSYLAILCPDLMIILTLQCLVHGFESSNARTRHAISELKKTIEKLQGKSVEKINLIYPSVVRQPNAQRIPKPSVLGKLTPFSNSPEMRSFQTKQSVNKTNVSDGSNDMVHNYYLEKAKKSAQLQKDKDVNGKPSMIDPARLPNTANGCKPKPRNWQASMSSRVSNKDVHLGEHRKQKPFLKFNDLQCPTCKKCLYSANHG
ncbi:hypothetical protein Tco_1315682 [Tanacetum coccineum]